MLQMAIPLNLKDQNICILGLGYAGLTLAVAMADAGFRVHGAERRNDVIESLTRGEPHFWEPRLRDKLRRVIGEGHLTFSRSIDPAFRASVYVITVGTPLGPSGKPSFEAVQHAACEVADHMDDGSLIILRSTVKLGTTRNIVMPCVAATGRRFDIAVCPERTLEGRALMEIRELPQIIGADEPATRARCQAIFGVLTHTNIVLSSPEAAELTKLIDNSYRDVMFAFANEIASLCSHAGLSALDIIRAGKLGYPRTNVALPGLVGGPCLEKDPHILVDSARDYGVEMAITAAARATNERQPSLTMRLLRDICRAQVGFPRRPVVTVAGLAFKGVPPTDDLRGTMAKHVIAELRTVFPDATLRGYDPVITAAMVRTLDVEPVGTLGQAFEGASIVVLANNHPEFQKMDLAALAQQMTSPGVVYDYWNLHEDTDYSMPSGVTYLALGSERYRAT